MGAIDVVEERAGYLLLAREKRRPYGVLSQRQFIRTMRCREEVRPYFDGMPRPYRSINSATSTGRMFG
jgi:hypothetical protein